MEKMSKNPFNTADDIHLRNLWDLMEGLYRQSDLLYREQGVISDHCLQCTKVTQMLTASLISMNEVVNRLEDQIEWLKKENEDRKAGSILHDWPEGKL